MNVAYVLQYYREAGCLNFGEVLYHLHNRERNEYDLLPENEDEWTDDDLTKYKELVMEGYRHTIDACGWYVEDFEYVYNRTPEAG